MALGDFLLGEPTAFIGEEIGFLLLDFLVTDAADEAAPGDVLPDERLQIHQATMLDLDDLAVRPGELAENCKEAEKSTDHDSFRDLRECSAA